MVIRLRLRKINYTHPFFRERKTYPETFSYTCHSNSCVMEIRQINEGQKGYFQAIENGLEAGRSTYSWAGDTKFIIDHTEVNPDFKGRNVGKALVTAAVEYARVHNLRILPLCPFAKSLFDKIPEWGDVWFKPATN